MSSLALAAVWVACAVLVSVAVPRRMRRRTAWAAPLAAGTVGLAVTAASPWPGPVAAPTAISLALGRPGLGLLFGAGVSLACTLLLAPRVVGGEAAALCLVGAACTVALSATAPVIWGLALACGVGVLAVRWIAAAPGRVSLAAGRITGVGAALLVAAAAFLPVAGPAVDTRTALAGGLLAAGVAALLALLPLGGWVAGAAAVVPGADLAAWGLLLGPTVLLSAGVVRPQLPSGARIPFENVLLVLGLASAIFGGLRAAGVAAPARYGRVLAADLALAAAGVGSTHDLGLLGGFVIVMTHLCAGPVLLNVPRRGVVSQARLAWVALLGLPPTPAFWGRLLVLDALAATDGNALGGGLLAAGLLTAAAIRALFESRRDGDDTPAPALVQAVAWAVSLAALALGFAPAAAARRLFGV